MKRRQFLIQLSIYLFLIQFFLLNNYKSYAQEKVISDTFFINLQNKYKITSLNIIPFSEKIYLSGKYLLSSDYNISYQMGIFSLSPNLNYTIIDTLVITYKTINLNLKSEYRKRSIVVSYEDSYNDTVRISQNVMQPFSAESIFGRNIQRSGAIIRGFSVGTNRDFQLNSGLRLQLSGKLSDDIEIVAALTDENTPIQPEGNTETLDELDKVFIELRHKNVVGTFGDYELNERSSEFSQITRKLQGLKGEFNFDNYSGVIAIAGSRGKFNTNSMRGFDGNQGPYRLSGINNERAIIIIAGSEKVYLDGELLKRGDNNDYVIDYSNAQITFTPKRLITSASRISIDFEYTDQYYKRNFFGTNLSTNIFGNRLKIGLSYYREGDDENNPIDFSFSDEDLTILRNAGGNRDMAVKSGVNLALPDSLGRPTGIYSRRDTLINQENIIYFLYTPGTKDAIYNVSFSFVGNGQGDYIRESLGRYKFVGKTKGSYLPIIFLPLPQLKQVGNFSISANVVKGILIDFELSGSNWDKNRFSIKDDSMINGYARKFNIEILPREINIAGVSLGKVGLSFKDRFIENKYSTLDRINEIEFDRQYNLPSLNNQDQVLREIKFSLLPFQQLAILSQYGFIKQGESFNSDRILTEFKLGEENKYKIDYSIDFVESHNNFVNTKWNRQNAKSFFSYGIIKPGIDFLFENKEDRLIDSLLATSLKYIEAIPFIEVTTSSSFDIRASYSVRVESFPLNKVLLKQSDAGTNQIQVNYRGTKEVNSNINFTFRKKRFTEEFKKIGFTDNETILFLSQNRFNFWHGFIQGELFYQAATEQTARLEKVFVKVPKGSGSYIYLGDLNNNGIAEENEFQLTSFDGEYIVVTTPTEELFPVIDLKTNTRWKFNFDRIFNGNDFLSKTLNAFSTETFFRIEEYSKENQTRDIYLLNFSKFLNDSTTVRGSQLFQQDLRLFQNSNSFSIRFRFLQRRNLNQFSGGLERGFYKERGIRIRAQIVKEINNQTEFVNLIDNLDSPVITGRARIVTRNDISTEFSYRPVRNIETGLKIQAGQSRDDKPEKSAIVDINSLTLRINYSITNIGRIRAEIERTELISNSTQVNIPFEITRGNVIGKNYFWRLFFDYRIANYIQTSVSYDARLQGTSRIIHSLRAEARAYF